MKRLHLLDIEIGPSTASLLDIQWTYHHITFDLFTVHTERVDIVHGYSECLRWHLFKVDYYRHLVSFQTIRADIYVFGRQFAWKRKIEESEELPF